MIRWAIQHLSSEHRRARERRRQYHAVEAAMGLRRELGLVTIVGGILGVFIALIVVGVLIAAVLGASLAGVARLLVPS